MVARRQAHVSGRFGSLPLLLAAVLAATGLVVLLPVAQAVAAPCDVPVVSPVACENTRPGNPESEWGVSGAGSTSIQGFATAMSVDQGETVGFKVDTVASSYRLDVYRMGYYAGNGARQVATVTPTVLNNQPQCITDTTTGLVDCGNWTQNAAWAVPADAVSGIYFAKLVRTDGTAGSSHVFFVVRDDDGGSRLLLQTSDTTWQAYNRYGGSSLYTGSPAGRAYKVSYNRPFTTRGYAPEDWVYNAEYPMVRWLESNGYDVSYTSGIDTDRRGAELLEHEAFLSVGHDEYWSGPQRANVEAARAAGVDLAFFSGNEVFWKTRWENSIDGSGTPYRTLVSYKETHANQVIDPAAPTWTGTWRDPRFSPPGDGGRPENALTGTMFEANCCAIDMRVGAADGRMRFWRGTRVASLATGTTTTIGSNVIGYEWDEDSDNGFRPRGLIRVSETTGTGEMLQDFGSSYANGTATHAMTLYRHSSGALVFGAGTIQWSWALDGSHDRGSAAPDTAAQQATVNLLADMGVQPTTLRPGLSAATASTDTAPPTSVIGAPADNAVVPVGTALTVTGTATDAGGGRVGGVEVSTDNGTTWRRATGRDSWSYSFTPAASGTLRILSRAADDSARVETPSAGITVTVGTGPISCPCTIWPGTATPQRTDPDRTAVELGVRFRASQDGFVTGIRFYKPSVATGTHVGSLWTNTGTKLAGVTFTNETASGWQQASFASPVPVSAGVTYVASYHAPSRYASNNNYFSTATTRGPLTALQDGTDGPNGVYRYGTTAGVFPNNTYNSENYWVDVVFQDTDTTKPTVTSRTPAPGATDVAVGSAVSAVFSEPVTAASVRFELRNPAGTLVTSSAAYAAGTRTATLTPAVALAPSTTYTASLTGAADAAGNVMDPLTWTFTTQAADTTKPTVTSRTPAPGATDVAVGSAVSAVFSEPVTAASVRFELRNPAGTLVTGTTSYASATRTSTLTPGSALAPSTTYTASLSGAADSAGNVMDPLSWTFTTEAADTTKPTVTGRTPAPGATGVAVGSGVSAVFSEAVTPSTITFELRNPAGTLVTGTTSYASATRTSTLTPGSALAPSTTYTASLSGATDSAGNVMDPLTWTFTTSAASPNGCPCSIWASTATPAGTDPDTSPVELGVRFRASQDGFITGLRYWRPSVSTGTHVGSLWTNTGTKLASVTFTNESASGWQQALFTSPVPVTAGVTYVASYFTPSRYAVSSSYFATSATTRGPLTALQNGTDGGNGVYRYTTSAGVFPNNTYNSENYWVDVVYQESAQDNVGPLVVDRSPAPGAAGSPVSTTVSATFSEVIQAGSATFELRTAAGALVPATTALDSGSTRLTLTPSAALQHSTTYSVTLSGARDPSGNVMAASTWTFQTAAPPPPPPDQGPGGPIAVVTSGANPLSTYLVEILRAEGLNEFERIDTSALTASSLAPYRMLVVGEVAVTDAQATAVRDWVDAGGDAVLMRPDSRFLPLAGLSLQTGIVSDGYLAVDAATPPGAGITTQTMQFHGPATRYALAGATTVAGLYSTATASTGQPAVTWRSVGSNGGQVAVFAYDLARSVVWTHQGNPAWAGQNRDGQTPNRSNDLFFGGTSTDWVNLTKVAVPQADEQQRLLANLLTVMSRDRMPLPRFWYFPDTHKAVVVATGDDHATGGTAGRFNTYNAASPAGCSVARWECARFSSYVYPGAPLTDNQAATYDAQGFEIGLHPQNGCANYASLTALQGTYSNDLSAWRAKYTRVASPTTSRFHCIVWSDWASQPRAELANGIRLDTNYYYYPGSWIQDRPGFMTGSGIPMRFTDTGGSLIDVYQTNTVMTDESEQSYPFTPDTLLDGALGPLGYYGAFTANMHTDQATTFQDTQLLASAQARGVPLISARQLLTWLDGRNGSSFGDLAWAGDVLSFSIAVGSGATGLTAMLPTAGPGGRSLTGVSRGGTTVGFTRMTVKGQEYAVFPAAAGSYQATYAAPAPTMTVLGARVASPGEDEATVEWSTTDASTSTVRLGRRPTALTAQTSVADRTTAHRVTLDGLRPGTRYHFRVVSRRGDGTTSRWPAQGLPPASFQTPAADRRAPVVRDVGASALPDGTARVTWRTDEPATSRVDFGSGRRLARHRLDDDLVRRHSVVLTRLEARSAVRFRVRSTDPAGNAAAAPPSRLWTGRPGVAVHTTEEFRTGTVTGDLRVSGRGLGALTLPDGGRGGYVSSVLDARQKVAWLRAVVRASLPEGARTILSVRTGSTPTADRSWSPWRSLDGGASMGSTGRYLQFRVELRAPTGVSPVVTAVGFTHDGTTPRREPEAAS